MCPINQLPLEILSEIFLHCIPASKHSAQHHTPQLLARVCKRWQILAHALPALWASIHIQCTSYTTYPWFTAIRTHLQRSSTHPITFSLYARNLEYSHDPTTPHLSAALLTLRTARERWQSVNVSLSVAHQSTIDSLTLGPAPLLRTFCCELVAEERKPASIPLFAPQACPLLESLSWTGFRDTPVHRPVGDVAWMHLTSLRLEASLSVIDCLTLLRLSPRLSTAELAAIDLPLTRTSLPRLVHQTLHTLYVEGSQITALLSALTLPALTHLHLDVLPFTYSRTTGACTGLHAFFARSAPPLQKLILTDTQLPEPELLRALALVPTLHTLQLYDGAVGGVRITAALIRALHPAPSSPSPRTEVLCPQLRSLRISGVLICPDGVCGAMLRARWGEDARTNGVAVLQRMHIELPGNRADPQATRHRADHRADHEAMRVLREEGMTRLVPLGR